MAAAPHGLWAPAVTPLGPDLEPRPELLAAHTAYLLDHGCDGVLLFGTTGEAPSFSVAERRATLDAVLAAGVPAGRLMVGVGCCALPDTVELARHAARAGCAGLLALPPFYFKDVSEAGLERAFAEVFGRLGSDTAPVLLYHFPRLSGVPVPPRLLVRLAERFPGVVAGVKDSSGDPASLDAFLDAAPDLAVFPGSELLARRGLQRGAAGAITATANVNAPAIRRLLDDPEADETGVVRFRETLQRYPLVAAVKRLLAERTGEPGWRIVRPPLVPLLDADWAELSRAL